MKFSEWIKQHDESKDHKYREHDCFHDGWVHCSECGDTPPADLEEEPDEIILV
jgi:hypothetical protein